MAAPGCLGRQFYVTAGIDGLPLSSDATRGVDDMSRPWTVVYSNGSSGR